MFRKPLILCAFNTLLPFFFKIHLELDTGIAKKEKLKRGISNMINTKANPLDVQKRIDLLKNEERITEQFYKLSKEYKLSRRVRNDVKKLLENFFEKLTDSETNTVSGLSHMVLSFYRTTEEHIARSSIYKVLTYEENWRVLRLIEKYLTARLNKVIFQCITFEQSENDAAIQKIIHDHYWITPKHLDSKISLEQKNVRDLLDLAVSDLNEINFKSSTLEKIDCIVECSKRIYSIIKNCLNLEGGADDFLPVFIYVVLKSNPPYLISNMKYIEKFSHPERILQEEEGYYYTTLCCAVNCIEEFSAKTLNLSQEDYNNYLSTKVVSSSPAVFAMHNNIHALNDLKFRKNKVLDDAISLKEEMNQFKQSLSKSINVFTISEFPQRPRSPLEHIAVVCESNVDSAVEEAVEVDEHFLPEKNFDDLLSDYIIIDEVPDL